MFPIYSLSFTDEMSPSVRSLYYGVLEGYVECNGEELLLIDRTRISFNSYFNAFYERYWREYTKIERIIVSIKIKGEGDICFYRDTESQGCYEIKRIRYDSDEFDNIIFDMNLSSDWDKGGRMFCDIISFKTTVVKELNFYYPENIDKKLSIGICTFNREDMVSKNLNSLVQLAENFQNLHKIFVVNQGDEFLGEQLLKLVGDNSSLIKVIKQDNLGGTGGFTRTLLETATENRADYHLLMDDDVLIDVDVIKKAFAFAVLAKKTIAVGGQMLDLLRPNILHEYGCLVDNRGYISPVLHNINLSDIHSLANFNRVHKIDFNAWWFCMIPTKMIHQIDYPAPIFIRGDDQEYGLRLKESGVETVGLPGVGLWHEPFYVKVGGWQTYYDFRNRMILARTYKTMQNEGVDRLFLRIYRLLLCHDYQSVKLIIEAVNDFAKGEKLFEEGADVTHARISKIAKDYAPKSVRINFKPIGDGEVRPKWKTAERRKNFAKQIALLSTRDFSGQNPKHLWDRHVSPENVDCRPYIVSNGIQSYHYLYSPNKKIFLQLLKELLRAKQIYYFAIQKNNSKWQNIANNKKLDYWKNTFKVE